MTTQEALLDIHQLCIDFGSQRVVDGINLCIAAGERVALVGESGSGKSVTALAILRLLDGARLHGRIRWQGRDMLEISEREMQALRGRDIAMVFQEPMTALNPLLTIGQQIGEVLALKFGLAPVEIHNRVEALLRDVEMDEPERRAEAYPHQLSGGQRQRAMIAMALACEPKLLLADEPTTALDAHLRLQILDLLGRLQHRHGMAILLITHDLALVQRFAHRVAVMSHGRLVEEGSTAQVLHQPRHAYTRQLLASHPDRSGLAPWPDKPDSLITASALTVRYPVPLPGLRGWLRQGSFQALHPCDFELLSATTLGIMGESGSGKTTLAHAMLGLQAYGGKLMLWGRPWQNRTAPDRLLRQRIQVVFQDPFGSLSPRRTVGEIVSEGLMLHHPGLSAAEVEQRVLAILAEVGLTSQAYPGLLGRYPHAFSGGQRQRIALARALIVKPQVLVLDEPTSALDVTVQQQVLQLLQTIQRRHGIAYVLITHDLEVLRAMAHQVMVLQAGQVVEAGPAGKVFGQPEHPYTQALLEASGFSREKSHT